MIENTKMKIGCLSISSSNTMHFVLSFMLLLFVTSISLSSSQSSRKGLRDSDVNQAAMKNSFSDRYNRVNPSLAIQLLRQPRVFLYKGLLSDEECDHLISTAVHSEENLVKEDADDSRNAAKRLLSDMETSSNSKDYIIKRIEEKISTWSLLPREYSKPLRVLKYSPEEANQKYQYFGNQSTIDTDQPLMATVIVYLSTVNQGGKIIFPHVKSSSNRIWSECAGNIDELRPIKGNAILVFTVHPNTTPDTSSYYERCPVLNGEMWVGIKLFYIKPLRTNNLLLGTDNIDCTDEDENCSHWAAIGECEKNPTYMIGSPDYYGTCRKSCSAC